MRVRFHDCGIETGSITKQELLDLEFRYTGHRISAREIYANGDCRIAFDPINYLFTKYRSAIPTFDNIGTY